MFTEKEKALIVPVLIVQTSPYGYSACLEQLILAGFEKGKDFQLFERTPENILPFLDPSVYQLLVTGTFDAIGSEAWFAKNCKGMHPRLTTAFYSVHSGKDPSFDLRIEKGDGAHHCDELIEEMKRFLRR